MIVEIQNNQLVIEGRAPMGLSFHQVCKRNSIASNTFNEVLWTIHSVYIVNIKIPNYIKEEADSIIEEVIKELRNTYSGGRGEVFGGKNKEDQHLIILFMENNPIEKEVAYQFNKDAKKMWIERKKPHYEARKLKRGDKSNKKSTYVKPSATNGVD